MLRRIIHIDEERCNGCGRCADACHEGAIGMVDGKARLLREDYCDGLGDCLPACPADAIRFEEREAAAYNEAAVRAHQQRRQTAEPLPAPPPGGCPGSQAKTLHRETPPTPPSAPMAPAALPSASELRQWPVQLKLAPVNAPYLTGAKLLVAADCTAYAYADFHRQFMRGRVTLIGCPKLDAVDYSDKLTEMLRNNDIRSVTVLRMEVPCCGGLEQAVRRALKASGKLIPWQVITLATDGRILDRT